MEFFKCLWQKSVTPEMNRKHTSNQKPVFIFSTVSLFWFVTQKQQKNIPSQRRCDSDLVSINFCIAAQSRLPLSRSRLPQSLRFLQPAFLCCPCFLQPALFCSCGSPCKFIKKIFQKNIDIRS